MIAMACLLGCFSRTVFVTKIDINLHMSWACALVFFKLNFQLIYLLFSSLDGKPSTRNKDDTLIFRPPTSMFDQLRLR